MRVLIILSVLLGAHAFRSPSPNTCVQTRLEMTSGVSLTRRSSLFSFAAVSTILVPFPKCAVARLESVNRPDLLPSEPGLNVIQTEKFLTSGQVRRMDVMLENLEKDTGFRVRVLCQNYPNTPGLAIRDYWDLGKEVCR